MIKPRIYLSGGQQFAEDAGVGWRQKITPELEKRGFGVFDPTIEENDVLNKYNTNWRDFINQPHNLQTYFDIGREFVVKDIQEINQSIGVLVYWDMSAKLGSGTACEVFWAHRHGIPIWFVTDLPLKEISIWTLGCVSDPKRVFTNFEDFLKFFDKEQEYRKANVATAPEFPKNIFIEERNPIGLTSVALVPAAILLFLSLFLR